MLLQRWISKVFYRLADWLPGPWRLPVRYFSMRLDPDVEPELVRLFSLCRDFRCAIDIGANHGCYAYKMAQKFERVFAFEANTAVDYDLKHYPGPNIRFFAFGLSDIPAVKKLRVPVKNGIPLVGWASLETRALPFAEGFREIEVDVRRLDDQPDVRAWPVDLIKIDVEGHELNVIRGAWETIRRNRPVLIVEDNAPRRALDELLGTIGYVRHDMAAFSGKPCVSPNAVFVPEEFLPLPALTP